MTIKNQAIFGVLWTFADTFLIRGMVLVSSLWLARILGPDEFGLIGMISIFIAIGITLVDSGLSSSLIRSKNNTKLDYSTVFFANLFISIIAYVIVFFAAPYIADFYNQPILIDIIRLYCLTFVISALSAVQLAKLNKTLAFKKIAKYNLPSSILGIIVGLYLGYTGFGVWSIVVMNITIKVTLFLILWVRSDWKPEFIFSMSKLKYHYNYGYKLLLSTLINKLFINVYHVIIGKSYSLTQLGYYERSVTFNSYSNDVITGIIKKVTFPLLAKIQDDKKKVAKAYKNILQLSFFITAPIMLGFAAEAKPIFLLILGEEWLPAVPYFQILCIASILYPNHSFNLNILKVYGRSDLFLKLEVYKKIVITILIFATYSFGILGLVWSSVFASLFALIINTYYSTKHINYPLVTQLKDMVKPFCISVLVSFTMLMIVEYSSELNLFVQIGVSSLVGIFLYVSISYLLKVESLLYMFLTIKNFLK